MIIERGKTALEWVSEDIICRNCHSKLRAEFKDLEFSPAYDQFDNDVVYYHCEVCQDKIVIEVPFYVLKYLREKRQNQDVKNWKITSTN